jgi:F0F1-type ATP synthase delta subunit
MDYLTKDQVDILKHEIDILLNSKYQSKKEELVRESTLLELESRRVKDSQKALENWKLEIENLRVLRLIIASEPTRANILAYGAWVKKTLGPDVILDISVNENLVAGAQIVWNGKYRDYSQSATAHADLQRLLS